MTLSVHSGAISRPSRLADAYCGRTLLQSHCSSSHTIMALEVHTPWPSSVWAMRTVTVSSGATTTQALTSSTAGSTAHAAPSGLMILRRSALRHPEADNERAGCSSGGGQKIAPGQARLGEIVVDHHSVPPSGRHPGGGQSDRLADAVIGAATARIGDLGVDLRIGRIGTFVQQRHNAHDHARLAVAALRYVELDPGELHGMRAVRRQAFDGGHRLTDRGRDRNAAGANRSDRRCAECRRRIGQCRS